MKLIHACALVIGSVAAGQVPLHNGAPLAFSSSNDFCCDEFGTGVAIDATTLAVGAPGDDGSSTYSGKVYVYELVAGTWQQQALIGNPGGSPDLFGATVALSGDRLAIGVPGSPSGGRVRIDRRIGTAWNFSTTLAPSGGVANDAFGSALSFSASTLAVGSNVNRAHVFVVDPNGQWTAQAALVGGDTVTGDGFGRSVTLDGDTLIVGAPYDDEHGADSGSVYVFTRSGSVWSEVAKLAPADGESMDYFGFAVAISGLSIAVGAHGDDDLGNDHGAVYVFTGGGASWTQQAKIHAPAREFGFSVALAGNRLIAGAPHAARAYYCHRDGTSWTNVAELGGAVPLDRFGYSVALLGDHVVVGDPAAATPPGGYVSGAALAYVIETPPSTYCVGKLNSDGCVPQVAWSGLPSASSATPFAITATDVVAQKNGLFFYGFAPFNAPFGGGTRCVAYPVHRTPMTSSGGSASCGGVFAVDFGARIASGADPALVTGGDVYGQWWYRDPLSSHQVGLSNAIQLWIWP